jgi:hypothetical protein
MPLTALFDRALRVPHKMEAGVRLLDAGLLQPADAKGASMKYLCLVYAEEHKLQTMNDDECVAYDGELRRRGQCVASEALQPAHTASTIRVRNGKVSITDGPFAETKETLAGFYLVDARDLNDAVQMASRIPAARVGSIEVRPIRPLAGRELVSN